MCVIFTLILVGALLYASNRLKVYIEDEDICLYVYNINAFKYITTHATKFSLFAISERTLLLFNLFSNLQDWKYAFSILMANLNVKFVDGRVYTVTYMNLYFYSTWCYIYIYLFIYLYWVYLHTLTQMLKICYKWAS